jgi:hypothetical protein
MTIKNPTTEEIKKAEAILATSEPGGIGITGDRYAETKWGTVIDNGTTSIPRSFIKAIRHIIVYSENLATEKFSLFNTLANAPISMYPNHKVTSVGHTPFSCSEIPNKFAEVETVIIYS